MVAGARLGAPVIRANLARGAAAHGFYEHLGCRTVKDQRVYELPL